MVLLQLFLLAGLDEAINPPRKRTIAKRVKLGFTDTEFRRLTTPIDINDRGRTGLGLRQTRRKKRRTITF